MSLGDIVDGLIIKQPWISKILAGNKTWEIRGSRTKKRGRIALIQSGSGLIIGEVDLVDCIGPLDYNSFLFNKNKHHSKATKESMPYPKTYAWVLENPVVYGKPKPYIHPQGAVIWVNLEN